MHLSAIAILALLSSPPADPNFRWPDDPMARWPDPARAITSRPVVRFDAPADAPVAPLFTAAMFSAPGPSSSRPALDFGVGAGVTRDSALEQAPAQPRPIAFEYSDGYRKRAKIHRYASFTLLPLFGAQAYLGRELFNNVAGAGGTKRKLHRDLAWGMGGLFGLNSVTGVMNLLEARKDPNGLTLRTIHAVLMLVADGGFVATAFTRPSLSSDIYDARKNQHAALAIASISTATVGYLIMLFGK